VKETVSVRSSVSSDDDEDEDDTLAYFARLAAD
jgi:hypothetical protein